MTTCSSDRLRRFHQSPGKYSTAVQSVLVFFCHPQGEKITTNRFKAKQSQLVLVQSCIPSERVLGDLELVSRRHQCCGALQRFLDYIISVNGMDKVQTDGLPLQGFSSSKSMIFSKLNMQEWQTEICECVKHSLWKLSKLTLLSPWKRPILNILGRH